MLAEPPADTAREHPLIHARPSLWMMLRRVALCLLLVVLFLLVRPRLDAMGPLLARTVAIGVLALAFAGTLWAYLDWASRRYRLTSLRIYARSGVLRTVGGDVTLAHAQGVVVRRSLTQRLLGLATISVASAGPAVVVTWRDMPRADALATHIRRAIDAAHAPSAAPRDPPPAPLILGLVGGIGAGKSAVAHAFESLGCIVSDSDAQAREILTRPSIRDQLVAWWGRGVRDATGTIDRKAVAGIVFADPAQRARLESLVHPLIKVERDRLIADAVARRAPAVIIDAPLLFEAGLDTECDAVMFVDAPVETRLARVADARGWSRDELARREKSQLPLDVKRRRADTIISNTGSLDELVPQARRVLQTYRDAASRQPAGSQPPGSPT